MILADTSMWVDHFHGRSPELASLLVRRRVVLHPFVIGELLAGNLPDRRRTRAALEQLPALPQSPHERVTALLDRYRLHGAGLGWIDLHLLCACRDHGARLATRDSVLRAAARRVGVPGK